MEIRDVEVNERSGEVIKEKSKWGRRGCMYIVKKEDYSSVLS